MPARRRFTRVAFRTEVQIDTHPGPRACSLVDISLKGAMVEADEPWIAPPGSPCNLLVDLGEPGARILMEGQVAHTEGNRLGIRCLYIDLDSVTSLRRLVELNLGRDGHLERELSAMVNAAVRPA